MEQQPRHTEGLPADETALAAEREQHINEGLDQAWRVGRRIDDLTAKRIARELTPGSGALQLFVETGAIPPGMEVELAAAEEVARDLELAQHLPWITALGEYLSSRLMKSEMPYWNDPSMSME